MTPNASGRANRVAPDGTVHAVADRGEMWGNRGRLLGRDGKPARHAQGRNWLICVLEFRGRLRTQWRPDRLTELYFLDEATGLAAGHRPCGECRHGDYQRFKAAWTTAHDLDRVTAAEIDRRLHGDRLDPGDRRTHRTHEAAAGDLPDGVVVEHEGGFWLVRGPWVAAWSHGGYGEPRDRAVLPRTVVVRTPRASVAAMRAGYEPACHASAP